MTKSNLGSLQLSSHTPSLTEVRAGAWTWAETEIEAMDGCCLLAYFLRLAQQGYIVQSAEPCHVNH